MKTIALALTLLGATSGVRGGRIFGGSAASPDQFPFIVSINDPDQLCNGVIIDRNWILTAANCLIEASSGAKVLVGTTSQHSGGLVYSVRTSMVHEDFDNRTLKNNIGLIQINGELTFNAFVQAIAFGDAKSGQNCTTAGWGMTEHVAIPEDLQYIEVETLTLDDCRLFDGAISEEETCAHAEQGQGFCYGDAGGPLVCEGLLVGLVSYLILPCGQGIPDVYTKVTAYADWIDAKVARIY